MVNDTVSWDSFGRIPPQGGPQADGETKIENPDDEWVYPSLEVAMAEVGLMEVEN